MPNVSLTEELEGFAERCVASGRYGSVSEVVRAALRLPQDTETRRDAFVRKLEEAECDADAHGWVSVGQADAKLAAIIAEAEAARTTHSHS